MKPAYDQLGDEYADSSSVLIGDADCTASADKLCEKFGIQGYPTIKVFKDGDTSKGEDYQSGRDYDSLKKYVVDNLEVLCDPKSPEECTDKEKTYIEKMNAKTGEEIYNQIERLTKMQSGKMKPELKVWLNQRLNILKKLIPKVDDGDVKEEL